MTAEHSTSDDLNTNEIKQIAELESSIDLRLIKAKEQASKIIATAREEAEDALEEARKEAAAIKTQEIEKMRQEEIDKSKLLIKQTEQAAVVIAEKDTKATSTKLFQQFQKLIGAFKLND